MKIFNIKKFTLIFFTFLCMFFTVKNVEAEEKYVCDYSLGFYNASNYYKNINLRVTYENGNYSIGTYDISSKSYYDSSTSTLSLYSNSYFVAGKYEKVDDGMHVFISKDTLNQFKTYDFATKKSCPSSVYFLAQMSNDSTDYNLSYYLSSTSLETYGYSNHNNASSCYNTGLCGAISINDNSDADIVCEYAFMKSYNIFLKLTIKKSNNIYLENVYKRTSEFSVENVFADVIENVTFEPDFEFDDLNKTCPQNLYLGIPNDNVISHVKLEYFSGSEIVSLTKKIGEIGEVKNIEEDICDGKTMGIIKTIFSLIRFLVPIIIIVLSIISFIGVVLSGEIEKMEKAKKNFIIRILIGFAILIIPALLELILKLVGIIDSDIATATCNLFK